MRHVMALALVLFAADVACELALPFDRSQIPEEGGVSDVGASPPEGDDAATTEDSSMAADAPVPSSEAGDAGRRLDGSSEDATARDGTADGMPGVDAGRDAGEAGEAEEAEEAGDASDAGDAD